MPVVVVCTILVLACAAGMLRSEYTAEQRLRKQVLGSFGKIPESCGELGNAVDYAALCRKEPDSSRVDDITWADLDMDLVFHRIDCCQSTVGEQVLYEQLHRLVPAQLDSFSGLLGHFEENRKEREEVSILLARLGKNSAGSLPVFLEHPPGQNLFWEPAYGFLAWAPFLVLPLFFLAPLPAFCLLFLSVCLNITLYYLGKRRVQQDLDTLRHFSSLLWLCEKLLSPKTPFSYQPVKGRLAEALPPFRPLRGVLSGVLRKGYSDLELLQEYFHILTLWDLRLYRKAVRLITENSDQFRELYECTGLLDSAVSVLSFRKSLPQWTAPEFHSESRLDFDALCHPLLRSPVPNSGSFSGDVLLTGSNASGKSTFLKALGVNAILAQSVSTCAAKRFAFCPCPVLSSMAVRDDITAGESYFIVEIKSLKRLTDAVRAEPCLLLIDEILKGTNTAERLAASQAVLEELHRRDCLCLAATHDLELTSRLSGAYKNYHFQEQLTGEGLIFDYRLRPGPSDTTNAIALLGHMGFSQTTVARARELAAEYSPAKGATQ